MDWYLFLIEGFRIFKRDFVPQIKQKYSPCRYLRCLINSENKKKDAKDINLYFEFRLKLITKLS